jgi:hypothetical protein
MCMSLATGGGGALLVKRAHTITAPREPARRALTGTVTEVLVQPCGSRTRPSTCYRPVISYIDSDASGRQPQQIISRTGYRSSSPHEKGDRVTVYIEPGGMGWLAREWDARQAERQREYADARRFPLVMGWLLIGCAAFGLLLAAGLMFFVDRSHDHAA